MRARVLFAGLVLAACIPKAPPVKAKAPMGVAVAFVNDRDEGAAVEPLPDPAAAPALAALGERNLRPRAIGRETVEVAFKNRRTTAHRLATLSEASEADLLLLVETRTRFYSALNGRYRWTVTARISMAKRDARDEAATAECEIPVFLDYDHQREADALTYAGPRIAEEVARVADDFLSGLASTSPPDRSRRADFGAPAPLGNLSDGSHTRARGAVPRSAEKRLPYLSPGTPISGQIRRNDAGPLLAGPPVAAKPAKSAKPPADSIYFLMVDRFANGNPGNDANADPNDPQGFHGGDLQGVLDKLDHIEQLGVSTVWLSPVFAMRTEKFHEYGAYHGYWTSDFGAVEPRFGDEALLRKLSDELHARGMRLVLDVVLNHVGPDTPLTKEHPEWFHGKGAITDWNDPAQLYERDVFGLPDLAQERDDVYRFLLDHSLRWIRTVKPDGFRLDAARHVPLAFWARYTNDLAKQAPRGFTTYGEMYDGDAEGLSHTLRKGGFDAVFDFPLYFAMNDVFCKDQPPARLASTLTNDRLYDDPRRLVTFLDNHDLPRVQSACGNDDARVAQALAFQLTARGTPSFTYGVEAGLTGEKEPANRADMRFDATTPLEETLRKLLAMRRDHPVFTSGASAIVALKDDLFVYSRLSADEVAVVAVNRGATAARVAFPSYTAGAAKDALTGEDLGAEAMLVAPQSVRIALLAAGNNVLQAATERIVPTGFAAGGVPAKEGDAVLVVGSAPELGSWNPANAKVLRKSKTGAFVGEVPLARGVYEWKLAVRRKDGTITWESGANRALHVDRAAESAAAWRSP